jgi:hypothetical protein
MMQRSSAVLGGGCWGGQQLLSKVACKLCDRGLRLGHQAEHPGMPGPMTCARMGVAACKQQRRPWGVGVA